VAGAKAAVLAELRRRKRVPIEDLRPHCASRKALIMMIYRLREEGYQIDSTPPKSAGGSYTYTLKRLPGSLKAFRHPQP
jgi:biotin operon repressor